MYSHAADCRDHQNRLLFRSSDLSQVKEYCTRQWTKLQRGDVSPQDFVIAKAVKLGSYAYVCFLHLTLQETTDLRLVRSDRNSDDRLPPPGAAVATRAMLKDHRAEPEYGERVPYVMFQGEPGTRQVDRAVSPGEFLSDSYVHSFGSTVTLELTCTSLLDDSASIPITTSLE